MSVYRGDAFCVVEEVYLCLIDACFSSVEVCLCIIEVYCIL